MRKSKLTAEEIQAAEKAADDRRISRGHGFSMMEVRDRGWARLNNGAVIIWPVDKEKRLPGVPYLSVPRGHFVLDLGGAGRHLFETDDFQKFLRWA